MILQIIKNPNPILRAKAKKLSKEDILSDETKRLILDMIETMREKEGIGLAAPQINKSIKLICVDTTENDSRGSITKDILPALSKIHGGRTALVLINPEITWTSFAKNIMDEGCLSVPGAHEKVKRPKSIKVRCLNSTGETIKFKAKALFARVLQHEIDHLDGMLFIDKL